TPLLRATAPPCALSRMGGADYTDGCRSAAQRTGARCEPHGRRARAGIGRALGTRRGASDRGPLLARAAAARLGAAARAAHLPRVPRGVPRAPLRRSVRDRLRLGAVRRAEPLLCPRAGGGRRARARG